MTIAHTYGADLTLGPTGDLAQANGALIGQQRVLRRLMTGPGAYIWHTDYGAGLGAFIGLPNPTNRIKGLAQQQMRKEAAVAQKPVPVVTVEATTGGTTTLTVSYADTATAQVVTLSAPVI